MKISLRSASACLLFMAWLGQVQSGPIDFRYKRRGPPPPPPRSYPMPHYMKNWESNRPPRGAPPRPRPIPMQVSPDFIPPPPISAPIGPPINVLIRTTPAPIRNHWKNTKPPFQAIPEKHFHSSPSINSMREFDYHVQTNNIPTHSIPIKQVGEKGPIHTIPAPNLSPADKPAIVEEMRNDIKIKPYRSIPQSHHQHAVQAHQYQVTEQNEAFIKNSQKQLRDQHLYYSNPQSYEIVQQSLVNKPLQTDNYVNIQGQLDDPRQSSNEIYHQILNSQIQQRPHQQQQYQQLQQPQQQVPEIYDNYEVPLLPQALVQQNPQQELSFAQYQALIAQSQLLQGDPSYMNQIQHLFSNQNARDNSQVQFQASTPERQIQNYPGRDEQSTFITTDYNFKAAAPDISATVLRDETKPDPNLPYVQEVFNLNEENVVNHNDVEQNIKISEENDASKEEDISSQFFTTLPNRKTAETLASLQAAGKMNNFVQINQQVSQTAKVNHRTPLEIYVPDTVDNQDDESQEKDNRGNNDNSKQEENISSNESASKAEEKDSSRKSNEQKNITKFPTSNRTPFGNRIRPKKN